MWYLLNSVQKEILRAWLQKNSIQKDMETILWNLEEAVITKDIDNNISFTNEKGHNLVRMITRYMKDKHNEYQIDPMTGRVASWIENNNLDQMAEKVTDLTVLESKVFQALNYDNDESDDIKTLGLIAPVTKPQNLTETQV